MIDRSRWRDGRNNVNLTHLHAAACGFESVDVRVHSAQLAVPLERGTPNLDSATSVPDPLQIQVESSRILSG